METAAPDRKAGNEELVAFLRERADLTCAKLQEDFVREYPRAKANVLDSDTIEAWTRNQVDALTTMLADNDASASSYSTQYGIVMEDPHEPELSMFASYLSTVLFIARTIAPLVADYYRADGRTARKAIDQLESFVQRVIEENCRQFVEEMSGNRTLSREWRLTSMAQPSEMPADSPARRYMDSVHYRRIAESMFEPAEPQGDALTAREKDVLAEIMKGHSNAEISQILGIAQNTVKKHVSHIFDKYNVFSRAELIAKLNQATPK